MDISLKDKETQQELLLQELDRGIDDIHSGRVYSVDESFQKVNDIRQMRTNCDKTIRDMYRAREDFENHERYTKRKMEELTAEIGQLTAEIDTLKKLLQEHGISYTAPTEQ